MRRFHVPVAVLGFVWALGLAATANAAAPAWWSYNRPADYTTVKSNVYVTMPDGTPIHCVQAQPAKNGVAVPGRFPALMEEYLPYGGLTASNDLPGDDFWADHGYVGMSCDIRGTGLSGGVWEGLLSAQENRDNYDLLEWMRKQPWSNGRLGQMGGSYGGMTTMRVASLRPPGLLAISPLSAEYDIYMENIYPGGIKGNPLTLDDWPLATELLSGGRELAAETEAQYLQHPLWDSFWQQVAVSTKWNQIKLPILGIGGWQDETVIDGAPVNWAGLNAAGNRQNYLIVGPWAHASTGPLYAMPGPPAANSLSSAPTLAQLAWFDHWVMGLGSAPLPASPVTMFEEPTGVLVEGVYPNQTPTQLPAGQNSGRGWQNYSSWPPPGIRDISFALTRDNTLALAPGPAATESYTTYPTDAGSTSPGGQVGPSSQTLVFSTAALKQDLAVAGSIVVHLRASLSYTDGNFKALLYDVAPDGSATFVKEGYLKASHRFSQERAVPVDPGSLTDFSIQLFPIDWRFGKGERLRLLIYGGESTELAPEPVPVTTTLSLGAGGSTVSLPILGDAQANTTAPPRSSCPTPSGRLAGIALGPVRLGMTRAQARRAFSDSSARKHRYMDFFCLTPNGIRVGYASTRLKLELSRNEWQQVQGTVVIASTANPLYALRGVHAGMSLAAAGHMLAVGRPFHVGSNDWYLTPGRQVRGVLKVRRGTIEEIGIADGRLTRTRKAAASFLRTFF
jgi:hypothetical protein